jgi:hypothetical protein
LAALWYVITLSSATALPMLAAAAINNVKQH